MRRPERGARAFAAWLLAGLLPCIALADFVTEDGWHTRLAYRGRMVIAEETDSGYQLNAGGSVRTFPRPPHTVQTASALFDALFALAHSELDAAHVDQIRFNGFNDGKPIPCECLSTGEHWPYVWTRDIAYATDLGLFRFEPQRTRNGLDYKTSPLRDDPGGRGAAARSSAPPLYVVQDTGSGGSWPVSTDRIAWFVGARHLLDDPAFAEKVYNALTATLAQDRRYVFDTAQGLYRGETSFLDWREQSYPAWTAHDVTFIAESFALSTNVLYYEALQLAAELDQAHQGTSAAQYRQQAAALKSAIDRRFWREDRGLYMSYSGGRNRPQTIEAYDLLGTSLAIVAGVAPPAHARRALANYPTWDAGSPVIWPERSDVPIYHNRALWPFVSAYAMRAARALDEPARIAHEWRAVVRQAALAGSNMENAELLLPRPAAPTRAPTPASAVHPPGSELPGRSDALPETAPPSEPRPSIKAPMAALFEESAAAKKALRAAKGEHSGPVLNSKRQLWSIAAFFDVVVEGVFGLTDRGTIEPKLPRELLPMLFGERDEIVLNLADRRITLVKPARLDANDNLLVAASTSGTRADTRVQLRGRHVVDSPLPLDRPMFAPHTPAPPRVERDGAQWRIRAEPGKSLQLYVNARRGAAFSGETAVAWRHEQQCFSVTERGSDGIESLPSDAVCVGDFDAVTGSWPRSWTAPRGGEYLARLVYRNGHGPIMTGITAAVKIMNVRCGGAHSASTPVVMPHNEREQLSTAVAFDASAGQHCTFALDDGFNMSYLAHNALYTGGEGGRSGALNDADIGDLQIVPVASAAPASAKAGASP